jgi:hypothetical protein
MSAHTPAPWRIEVDVPDDQDIVIVAGDPREPVYEWTFVAHVCGPDVPEDVTEPGRFDRAEALANARLIVAAPKMATLLLSGWQHVSHGGPTRGEVEDVLREAGLIS